MKLYYDPAAEGTRHDVGHTSPDFFGADAMQLPRLGDTPYELLTSSAREAANLLPSWDGAAPVVFVGDGSQTQADQNGATTVTAPAVAPSLSSAVGGVFQDALKSTLVGAAAIVILGIGAFILLRGD